MKIDLCPSLGAFLDTLPLMSAQRLFHMLYPETLNWKFRLNERHDTDQKIFDYFLWTRASHEDVEPHTALVVAYQPPWVLAEADFLEFVRSTSVRWIPPRSPHLIERYLAPSICTSGLCLSLGASE